MRFMKRKEAIVTIIVLAFVGLAGVGVYLLESGVLDTWFIQGPRERFLYTISDVPQQTTASAGFPIFSNSYIGAGFTGMFEFRDGHLAAKEYPPFVYAPNRNPFESAGAANPLAKKFFEAIQNATPWSVPPPPANVSPDELREIARARYEEARAEFGARQSATPFYVADVKQGTVRRISFAEVSEFTLNANEISEDGWRVEKMFSAGETDPESGVQRVVLTVVNPQEIQNIQKGSFPGVTGRYYPNPIAPNPGTTRLDRKIQKFTKKFSVPIEVPGFPQFVGWIIDEDKK